MKKLLFWMVLVVGTVVLLGSCAKKEETDDAAATSCETNTTASGSITVGSETMSGVYLSGCVDLTGIAGQQVFPSDVKSGKKALVVTGDAAISDEFLVYTDTACSTPSLTWKQGRTNFTVGSASGSNYAVTFTASTLKIKPSTDVRRKAIWTHLLRVQASSCDFHCG